MNHPFEIRIARPDDAPRISELINEVAHCFSRQADGKVAAWFLDSIAPQAIAGCINNPEINYLVACSGPRLVGVIAVRDTTHVFHLFVAPAYHRQGVATQLWARAKSDALRAGNQDGFVVRSSVYAVPVYERFGFQIEGARSEKDGIVFVPMRFELQPPHG